MLKLRKILLLSYPFYLFFILGLTLTFLRLSFCPGVSNLRKGEKSLSGVLDSYRIRGDSVEVKIRYQSEYVIGYYYFENVEEKEKFIRKTSIGDQGTFTGTLKRPKRESILNGFSYRDYLKTQKTYFLMNIESYKISSGKKNWYYKIRGALEHRIGKAKKSAPYLKTFILGNQDDLKKEVTTSFQKNGISHLFAISGMHIGLLSGSLLFLLKKLSVSEKWRYLFVNLFLFSYLLFTFSPSCLRATLFFLFFSMNELYYFHVKSSHILLVTFVICLFINPYFLFELGFQYSFLISFCLMISSSYIEQGHGYHKKLLRTSLVSFFGSAIISIYHFYEINFLSILYNLFYVPFVSFLLFPLSIITFLLPFFDDVLYFFLTFLEKSSLLFSKLSFGSLILGKPNTLFLIFHILALCFFLFRLSFHKKCSVIFLLLLFLSQMLVPYFQRDSYLLMMDVGQGDSILLKSKNEVLLVDTGGVQKFIKKGFEKKEASSIVEKITIPYLKSQGIRKINTLILTHGDFDHLGEAKYLVENFNVENIIMNSGKINYLEEELIKNRENVIEGNEGLKISCGDFELIQLNEEYQDENASSQIYYVTNGNINILLTGDAPTESERNLIKKYDLPQIDILKVGHHGSKTSSSKEFINTIKPKYSLISCGKDNKFGHPNKKVLDHLGDSIIYRTDIDGSTMFKIKKDKLDIETYPP